MPETSAPPTPTSTLIEARTDPAVLSGPDWLPEAIVTLAAELTARHGESQAARIERGLAQVARLWREKDGDRAAFEELARTHYAGTEEERDALFERFETLLEQLDGHMTELQVAMRRQVDLDLGPVRPFDEVFSAYDPSAHVLDDFFESGLAFIVLLNFPLTTLDERLAQGADWSRREWAEARLAQRFGERVPAEAKQAVARASAEASSFVVQYNIHMHHLLTPEGERPFPEGLRLLSHWGLRDEIKARYADGAEGLERQRMIQRVMERIVTQTLPAAVVDGTEVDYEPFSNEVRASPLAGDGEGETAPTSDPEPLTRYRHLLSAFHAVRRVDPHVPKAPTHIARSFDEGREMPEEQVEAIFRQLLASPLVARVGELISRRLGRPLEPFDIWYSGFRPGSDRDSADLDALVRERYPNPAAFEADIPRLLAGLGFPEGRAREIAGRIRVDPARGAGHAWGASMRGGKTRLRTRIGEGGMLYNGFNVAAHELGHNVEQAVTLDDMDHTLLAGVPNVAFTEAMAFLFQARDFSMLGLGEEAPEDEALRTLDAFWNTAEIASVALVDMAVWHWMYEHPEAGPEDLRDAVLRIARELWNRYWEPVLGGKDSPLLGVYSHMIDCFLYLPDYPLGHLIAHQIEEHLHRTGKKLGEEVERILAPGNVTPDLWMQKAVGEPVGCEAMLAAAERALGVVG